MWTAFLEQLDGGLRVLVHGNVDISDSSPPGPLMAQSITVGFPLIWIQSYLSQLLYLGTFYPDDAPCQALMNQQAKLAVKINPTVMLVLKTKTQSMMENISRP